MSSVVGTFLYSSNSANKLYVSWELLEYKGTGSKHLTQTCEVLEAYDTELAENRDKKSYRGKENPYVDIIRGHVSLLDAATSASRKIFRDAFIR
ncbi:protein belonging to Uncharacterized protein family UPF0236 [Clostridium sp. CAG:62]|nr:protein belonging to Uncharacterized protein family UPF0236 [Clostridium sp. CAG:62]